MPLCPTTPVLVLLWCARPFLRQDYAYPNGAYRSAANAVDAANAANIVNLGRSRPSVHASVHAFVQAMYWLSLDLSAAL